MFNPSSCTSILIGKKATADGSILIGRNEDSKAAWPKHFVVHARQEYTQTQHYKSKANGFEIDLPKQWAKYTATPEWTDEAGLFEEDGINEYGVAMSATESAYANARVLGYDPLVKDGIGEEAMVTAVLPFIHSAKEGVLRLGQIISELGTCESNGILFADHTSAWYMETGSGHQWVAQRIPDDSYAVVANQLAIEGVDFNSVDFLYANTLQDFCRENHLWQQGTNFNFRQIFGTNDTSDRIYNIPRVWDGQRYLSDNIQQAVDGYIPFLRKPDRPLNVEDAMQVLSSHFDATKYDPTALGISTESHKFRPISLAKTQESHVLQLRPDKTPGIGDIHWLAMGVAAESVYVPFYAGTTETPKDYQIGEMKFDANSAYWQAKQLSVLLDAHFNQFMPTFLAVKRALFSQFLQNIKAADADLEVDADVDTLSNIATKASLANAKLAKDRLAGLYSDLLIKATDMSPLNFKTDANL